MDQKFILAANLQEKLKLIETQDKKLPPQELENLYKLINTDIDAPLILDVALERNYGGLLPDKISYSFDYNENVFKKVIQSIEDLQLMGLYVKYIEQNCRSESVRSLFKIIGFETERQIRKFRQQGTIKEKLNIQQEIVIEMVSKLCPTHMNYNPELFSLMMTPFQKATNIDLLSRLADSLLQQCQDLTSLNDQHDWLILLSTIFEQSYLQKTLGICILIEKIGKNKLMSIIEQNWNYLFIKYFNDPEKSVKIVRGLIRFSLLQESISIIITISEQLKDQMINQKSFQCFKVLEALYDEVIIPQILPNLHMNSQIFDLLLFYMVGLCDCKALHEQSITLICERLKLIIDLKQSRDQYTQIFQFTHILIFHYPDRLKKHEVFNKIHVICKERSESMVNITYDKWNLDFENESTINYSQFDRETQNYVGLENLTNTCYMNSILQSLYMTQSFRKFVLLSPQTLSIQFNNLQKLFMLLNFQQSGFCSPYELKRTLRAPYGNSNDQQDVSEFAHHFLEDLLHELPQEQKKILENIFYGTHRSIIECVNNCPKVFGQNEKFLGLDLHFHEENDLNNMIRKLYEEENIEFTCEKCNLKSNRITKSQQIVQFPSVLFMTIQRFKYDVAQQSMTKILTKVPMKFEIDMREVFGQPQLDCYDSQYILYAFIVHLGKNSYSGHYICYARSMTNPESWITFDDTQISKQEWSSLQLDTNLIDEETPYLLFYQNKSGSPLVFNN